MFPLSVTDSVPEKDPYLFVYTFSGGVARRPWLFISLAYGHTLSLQYCLTLVILTPIGLV